MNGPLFPDLDAVLSDLALARGSDPRCFLGAIGGALRREASRYKGEERKTLSDLARNLSGLTAASVERERAGGRAW